MNRKTNAKGITLIALVVTIIILLILAGVSISLLAGGDGIMAKAQNALIQNNVAEAKERVNLKIAEFKTDYYRAVYVEKSVSVNTKLGDWIAGEHGGEVIKAGDYEFTILGAGEPYTITILENNRLQNDIVGNMSADGQTKWQDEKVAEQAKSVAKAKTRVVQTVLSYQDEFYEEVYVDQTTSVNAKFGNWMADNYGGQEIPAGDYTFGITGSSAPYVLQVMQNENLDEEITGELSEEGKITWAQSGSTNVEVTGNAQDSVAQANSEYKNEYYKAVYIDQTVSANVGYGDWLAENYGGKELTADDYTYQISGEAAPYAVKLNKSGDLSKSPSGQMDSDGNITWVSSNSDETQGGAENPGMEQPDEPDPELPTPEEPEPDPEPEPEPEPEDPEIIPDTTAPTVPTSLTLTSTDSTITAVASGSTDNVDSEVTYEYSMDKTNWKEEGQFSGLTSEKTYTVYARAKDDAGNISQVLQKSIKTKYKQTAVNTPVKDKNATVTGANPNAANPIIPVGFKAIETTAATWADKNGDGNPDGWNNGLVIEDGEYNQFVWVPVDGVTIKYAKNMSYPNNFSASLSNTVDDVSAMPTDTTGTTISETTQITKYGGFYVGRYEAGIPNDSSGIGIDKSNSDVEGKPTIFADSAPWIWISYNKAILNAKNMYSKSASVRSSIVTGAQWDTICAWINSELDEEGKPIHDVLDSRTWGNFSNTIGDARFDQDGTKISGTAQAAGRSEYWKAKNIYDFAGNMWEWSAEKRTASGYTNYRTMRGGYSSSDGTTNLAAYRSNRASSYTSGLISFRVSLYIM